MFKIDIDAARAWASTAEPMAWEEHCSRDDRDDETETIAMPRKDLKRILFHVAGSKTAMPPWWSPDQKYIEDARKTGDLASLLIHPITCPYAREFHRLRVMQLCHNWSPYEMKPPIGHDFVAWETIDPRLRRLFAIIVAFFNWADTIVGQQALWFVKESGSNYHASAAFIAQANMEAIHQEFYALVGVGIPDRTLFNWAISLGTTHPAYIAKYRFIDRHMSDPSKPRWFRAVVAALAEGIMFVGAFTFILYFTTTPNTFLAFITGNRLVIEDEAMHAELNAFAVKYFAHVDGQQIDPAVVREVVEEAVRIECNFIAAVRELMGGSITPTSAADLIDHLDQPSMENYIRMLADRVVGLCGLPTIYNVVGVTLPSFLSTMRTPEHANFFERGATTYTEGADAQSALAVVSRLVAQDFGSPPTAGGGPAASAGVGDDDLPV